MNIKALLDLTCQTVANMIKGARTVFTPHLKRLQCACALRALTAWRAGKTPEEIRKTFNIKNDFTPEEEEEVRAPPSVLTISVSLLLHLACVTR
jgi:hypothetical protein